MTFNYTPRGTCSKKIEIEIEGTTMKAVRFTGGCNGNGKGIGALTEGMEISEVIKRCKGITCGMRKTSCPDQLALALEDYQQKNNK